MKILISGRSSFIARYLEPKLVAAKHQIFGLENEDGSYIDLRDKDKVEACIQRVQPEVVIHLAAKTEVANSFDNYHDVSEINFVGTVILAEANRRFNPHLRLFLFSSSMETYGHQPAENGPFTEDTPQYPMAPYAIAKLACEKYLYYMRQAYDFPFVILRQTNAYGRTDNDFFVMERIITQMLWEDTCNLGDPDPIRNFIFIDDLIDLYMTILEQYPSVLGETFVVGPDNSLSIRQLAYKVADIIDWNGEINWYTIPKRPGEIYYLNSIPLKAGGLLGWEPRVTLDEGIKKTIDIWKNQYIERP